MSEPWLAGEYTGRRFKLVEAETFVRGQAMAEQQRRIEHVEATVTVTLAGGGEEIVTQSGGPKLSAAWLRALADDLDPRPTAGVKPPTAINLHGSGPGGSVCR